MLETKSHNLVKSFLQKEDAKWPHDLTLTRLVARSLRRRENAFIKLNLDSQTFYWLGLLIPLCLSSERVVLVLTREQRLRLIGVEVPRLKAEGLNFQIWEEIEPPPQEQIWLLDYQGFVQAYKKGYLCQRYLIIPDADFLIRNLRKAMGIRITFDNWEELIRNNVSIQASIIHMYERLTRKLFRQAVYPNAIVKLSLSDMQALKDLCAESSSLSLTWQRIFNSLSNEWANWAELKYESFSWEWNWQPLNPLNEIADLSEQNSLLIFANSLNHNLMNPQFSSIKWFFPVEVVLGAASNQPPIPLFVPKKQLLPNNPNFYHHVLNQCRRLILGQNGLTIILLNDKQFRFQLASQLASEFGRRVVHEIIPSKPNSIVCCSCDWWIDHQNKILCPSQLVFTLIPFPSMESPLTATMVDAYKKVGRDWFREALLPETLCTLSKAIVSIRGKNVRVAILDGRLRRRSWGKFVLRTFEPWVLLDRLLPH